MPANGLVATSYNLAASAEASVTNTTRNRTSSVCNSLPSVRRSTNGRSRVGQRAEASPLHRRVFETRGRILLGPRTTPIARTDATARREQPLSPVACLRHRASKRASRLCLSRLPSMRARLSSSRPRCLTFPLWSAHPTLFMRGKYGTRDRGSRRDIRRTCPPRAFAMVEGSSVVLTKRRELRA